MIIRQTTTIVFEYPQDYLQEQEWCKTKGERWIHKSTSTLGAVYENTISHSIGQPNRSEIPTGSTSSKMEQVDKDINVRSKDEPKLCRECEEYAGNGMYCASNYLVYDFDTCKDEPQTEIKGSKRLLKGSDEPQQKSCATCKHALGNWDGESNNCGRCCGADRRFYEPKDEPQTEREDE